MKNRDKFGSILYPAVFALLMGVTGYGGVTENEGVFAPMLIADLVLMTIWLFRPDRNDSATAYRAIIAYGAFIALLSVIATIFGPAMSERFGWEPHHDDPNGITYPVVNDGRENCYFTTMLFLIYFSISIVRRIKRKRGTGPAV